MGIALLTCCGIFAPQYISIRLSYIVYQSPHIIKDTPRILLTNPFFIKVNCAAPLRSLATAKVAGACRQQPIKKKAEVSKLHTLLKHILYTFSPSFPSV